MLSILAAIVVAPVPVRIVEVPGGHELRRAGKPFYVRGAGAHDGLPLLKASGANSIRTWGSGPDVDRLLDRAQEQGLTVTVGIWLNKQGQGMDYKDPAQVRAQREAALKDVMRLRSHPALLMWSVGNEMELGADGPSVWKAVEGIAREIKRLDPNHPVISVVADMWPDKMRDILTHAPSLDALGVNSYSGLPTLHERMARCKKPYFVTEFGFPFPQDYPQTPWKTPHEPNTTAKGRIYLENYQKHIAGHPKRVLGSFVFHWSRSGVGPMSWYAMLLQGGERTAATDAMQLAWTGLLSKNRVPEILSVEAPQNLEAKPGQVFQVVLNAKDPEGDALAYRYEIMNDDPSKRFVGDHEMALGRVAEGPGGPRTSIQAPNTPGMYRVVLVVRDGKGGAAAAAVPFRVAG